MFDVRPGSAAPLAVFVLVNGLLVSTLASLVADPTVMQVRPTCTWPQRRTCPHECHHTNTWIWLVNYLHFHLPACPRQQVAPM